MLASVPKLAIVGVCALLRASRMVGPIAAGFEIDEVGHVAGGNPQLQRRALDRGAVDELRMRHHRGDGGELVDDDAGRRLAAHNRQQRDRRIVAATLELEVRRPWPPDRDWSQLALVPAPTSNRPSLSVLVCASCLGAPALAAHRVTVDWAMGAPPPST